MKKYYDAFNKEIKKGSIVKDLVGSYPFKDNNPLDIGVIISKNGKLYAKFPDCIIDLDSTYSKVYSTPITNFFKVLK